MKEYYGFVYMWVNNHPDVKIMRKYIGQHAGTIDDGYIGSGIVFKRYYNNKKYKNYWTRTILQYCSSVDELNTAEEYWIRKYNAVLNEEFCNLTHGGTVNNKGIRRPTSEIKRIVKTRMSSINKKYEMRDNAVLNHIKKYGYWSITDNTMVNYGVDDLTRMRLQKANKIKLIKVGRYSRYVFPEVTLENEIINYIKQHPMSSKETIMHDLNVKWNVPQSCNTFGLLMSKLRKEKKIDFYQDEKTKWFVPKYKESDLENEIINYIKLHPNCLLVDIINEIQPIFSCDNVHEEKIRKVVNKLRKNKKIEGHTANKLRYFITQ